jgi:hypothetical protein
MDVRKCEQCGTAFSPRREHERFCSGQCRVTWNRNHSRSGLHGGAGVPLDGESGGEFGGGPLGWAVTAMGDTVGRLGRTPSEDQAQALIVIAEAVWWVTIVDATLVRYHPDVYDSALAELADRDVDGSLAGLRFVRNQLGYHADSADFVAAVPDGTTISWRWKAVDCPALEALPPRGQEWEASRYAAYREYLSGHLVGDTFRRAAAFLTTASATVLPST